MAITNAALMRGYAESQRGVPNLLDIILLPPNPFTPAAANHPSVNRLAFL